MTIEAAEITIDEELSALIPPLSGEEYAQLEENLKKEGCRDPLVVWGGTLVDGHNRFEICTANGICFDTVDREFESREAAKDWIDANQLGRRNLSPNDFALILGRRYNRTKQGHGGARLSSRHSDELNGSTNALLAAEHGVAPRTVERAGQYAAAVDVLSEGNAQDAAALSTAPRKDVVKAAKSLPVNPTPDQVEAARAHVHVAQNSGQNEWYTPAVYIEAARAVMGGIDFDPASSEKANETVQATTIYTKDDSGLDCTWRGRVWMNPPYAQPLIQQFCEKMTGEIEAGNVSEALALVNNATETKWFQLLADASSAICFPRGRVKFVDVNGNPGAPLQGQAVLYFGTDGQAFVDAFLEFGVCVRR